MINLRKFKKFKKIAKTMKINLMIFKKIWKSHKSLHEDFIKERIS